MLSFSSTQPIQVFLRPPGSPHTAWQELDTGPGVFHIPDNMEAAVRIRSIDDRTLRALIEELQPCPALTALNLSENRNLTDSGVALLPPLTHLTWLNLSSCSLTNPGIAHLAKLSRLEHLDLSFCNRLTDPGLKPLLELRRLRYLDLLGCIKITHAGVTILEQKKHLTIRK